MIAKCNIDLWKAKEYPNEDQKPWSYQLDFDLKFSFYNADLCD